MKARLHVSGGSNRKQYYQVDFSFKRFLLFVFGCARSLLSEGFFSSCGAWALGNTGLVAPWHVASSQTRDQTRVPCMGRWILNHWTTREVPGWVLIEASRVAKAGLLEYMWLMTVTGVWASLISCWVYFAPAPCCFGQLTCCLFSLG